ncbi:MAG TPA: Crp/Fnr family transcriptional regulator [Bacteroidia bacterium]|jgi:CRP-like cAMP-binding protein|nr:Crp/Fnr family transcriptional regulator [Bacteroidia bacterium]
MGFELEKFYFANTKVLQHVPTKDRLMLEKGIQKRKIKAGKIIYREGTLPKGVYILKKGKVKIYQTNQDGRKQIMYIYIQGEIFGYRPIICDEVHPVTAASLEDCSYDFIPAGHFLHCLKQSYELNHALLVSLSHEFSVWVNNVSVFAQYPVKSRVALGLLVLREKYREKGKSPEINLSRTDLASYVGTVKESVVRVLQEFKKQRIVETQGRKIRIVKPEELKTIVSFY